MNPTLSPQVQEWRKEAERLIDDYASAPITFGMNNRWANIQAHLAAHPFSQIVQEPLPGFLFIAMDDDGCANPEFCADEAAVRRAVQEAMLYTPEGEQPSAEDLEMVQVNADELLENETLTFEGDPPLHLYKLHDGADVVAQAKRQAFFLAQERDRALAASPQPVSQPGEALPAEQPKSEIAYPVVAVGSDLPPAPAKSWREIAVRLWMLLDDIDTLDDACHSGDTAFRNHTRNVQQKRHAICEGDDIDADIRAIVSGEQHE